jgi:GntR family transcriptional repressor for pyruvate dehydrogenase complex
LFDYVPRVSNLSSSVTTAIESLLVEQRLQPGDRLPSERELANQFGVSRTVVREAVRALVAKGLLEVRPGSGTIIRRPTAQLVSQSITLFWGADRPGPDYEKVLEVRHTLEVEIAALAAVRRTQEDLDEMEAMLSRISLTHQDRESFATDDVAFHAALTRATHNELYMLLLESISDLMLDVRRTGFQVPGTPERALAHHHEILKWVSQGDPERARQAMREHLVEAEETQRRAWLMTQDQNQQAEQVEEEGASGLTAGALQEESHVDCQ